MGNKIPSNQPRSSLSLAHVTTAAAAETNTLDQWYRIMAHQNLSRVKKVLDLNNIHVKDESKIFCEPCAIGKSRRMSFLSNSTKTERIGEVIHADVCGPIREKSMKGSRYYLLLKDDY